MNIVVLLLSILVSSHALSDKGGKFGSAEQSVSRCDLHLRDERCFKDFFFIFIEGNVHRNRRCIRYVFNYFRCEQSNTRSRIGELEDRLEELEDR